MSDKMFEGRILAALSLKVVLDDEDALLDECGTYFGCDHCGHKGHRCRRVKGHDGDHNIKRDAE